MVKKSDWHTCEMPEQVEHFIIEKGFSSEEMESIKEGHMSRSMDDKWFLYFEDNKLFCHRSWTGYCIYIVDFSEKGKLKVTVNRDSKQHGKDPWGDDYVIHMLFGKLLKKGENNHE